MTSKPPEKTLPSLAPGQAEKGLIQGPQTVIEYRLEMPATAPVAVALICHPHPLYQGTMDNKVVYTLSRIALAQGCAALRFQFRGVGDSTGEHAQGEGEADDAVFLLKLLSAEYPGLPAVLLGFSFGAYVALTVAARRPEIAGLVTIAPPLMYAGDGPVPVPHCPWLVVHGTADEVVSYADTKARAQALRSPPQWVSAEGVGHFFHGQLGILRNVVPSWLSEQITAGGARIQQGE